MHEAVESRLRALARRAGWAGAPPSVVAAGLGLAGVAVVFALWRWWPAYETADRASSRAGASAPAEVAHPATLDSGSAPAASADGGLGSAGTTLCVHVVGAVKQPGVYVLAAGTRVGTAIEVAGGVSGDGAAEAINLAAKVEDGQQVVVPTREQVAKGEVPAVAPGGGSGGAGAAGTAAKVDLNTADATQFDTLPGVGPSTAAKIVADREANGRFKSVDDLGRVTGIGPKKLDTLRDLVVVR